MHSMRLLCYQWVLMLLCSETAGEVMKSFQAVVTCLKVTKPKGVRERWKEGEADWWRDVEFTFTMRHWLVELGVFYGKKKNNYGKDNKRWRQKTWHKTWEREGRENCGKEDCTMWGLYRGAGRGDDGLNWEKKILSGCRLKGKCSSSVTDSLSFIVCFLFLLLFFLREPFYFHVFQPFVLCVSSRSFKWFLAPPFSLRVCLRAWWFRVSLLRIIRSFCLLGNIYIYNIDIFILSLSLFHTHLSKDTPIRNTLHSLSQTWKS